MPITLSTPTTQPAKTFDILWITNIQIASDVGAVTNLRADFTAARNIGTPDAPVYEGSGKVVTANLADIYTLAATQAQAGDTTLATALQAVLAAVQKIATEQSVAEKLAGTYVAPAK